MIPPPNFFDDEQIDDDEKKFAVYFSILVFAIMIGVGLLFLFNV